MNKYEHNFPFYIFSAVQEERGPRKNKGIRHVTSKMADKHQSHSQSARERTSGGNYSNVFCGRQMAIATRPVMPHCILPFSFPSEFSLVLYKTVQMKWCILSHLCKTLENFSVSL